MTCRRSRELRLQRLDRNLSSTRPAPIRASSNWRVLYGRKTVEHHSETHPTSFVCLSDRDTHTRTELHIPLDLRAQGNESSHRGRFGSDVVCSHPTSRRTTL